jgi:hypothetical protein
VLTGGDMSERIWWRRMVPTKASPDLISHCSLLAMRIDVP